MLTRTKLWLFSGVVFVAFCSWYTDLRGPLSDEEVAAFVSRMSDNGGDPDVIAFIEQFAAADSGRQFFMLNNVDYNETPPDVAGAEPGESARALMGRYMAHMVPALLTRACHPVLMGDVVYSSMDVIGIDNAEQWDMGALVRYRSRRTFLEIVSNPAFAGQHHFKLAALQKTIAYPIEARFNPGDPRLLLGLILLCVTALLDGRLKSRAPAAPHPQPTHGRNS